MPKCGTQICICDLPIRYDTYTGCTHACRYCFVQRKTDISNIELGETPESLLKFIKGERNNKTRWCDWNIPIHFGGMSDPFQPAEAHYKRTLEALKIFEATQYPVVISTKGKLCIEDEWLSVLKNCNVVMQISMACSTYDQLEKGAPTFEERLHMAKVLSENVPRVIARCQPYLHECFDEIMKNIPRMAESGIYGVIFEAMKFVKKKNGLVKVGGDYTYPVEVLKNDFTRLKEQCHKYGIKFYAGENRLRTMGDSLTCCGIDGLEGFTPNKFNGNHLLNGEKIEASEGMKKTGCSQCFKSLYQDTIYTRFCKDKTFEELMLLELQPNSNTRKALGKE